jgi:alpha-methylacyl-CoA racemase
MVDGAALLAQMVWAMRGSGLWSDDPGRNLLDGGCPYYDTYRCADGRFVAVGALEPAFWQQLLAGVGVAANEFPDRDNPQTWPRMRERFTAIFASRTRDEWAARFDGTDACVTPVLTFAEAPTHPHLAARNTLIDLDGVVQPAPAPRFSRTPAGTPGGIAPAPIDVDDVLAQWTSQRDGAT